MDTAEASTPADTHPDLVSRTAAQPLTAAEQAVLTVLDDQLVCASVVRSRARLLLHRTSRTIAANSLLSGYQPVASTLAIYRDLERRGLAERVKVAGIERWRRA